GSGFRQKIPRDLPDGELIEGHVGIERADDPVAIWPEIAQVVALETVRIGIPCKIEPRARPAFTVLRGCEQAIDDALVRLRALIGEEVVDLLWGWRQPDQIERHAAEPARLVDFGRGSEPLFRESGANESIDGIYDFV